VLIQGVHWIGSVSTELSLTVATELGLTVASHLEPSRELGACNDCAMAAEIISSSERPLVVP
jgi:hypothetical protein